MLIKDVMAAIEPLADKLFGTDAVASMEHSSTWLVTDIEKLFDDIPALRSISVSSPQAEYRVSSDAPRHVVTGGAEPLPATILLAHPRETAAQRLFSESEELFWINFYLHQDDSSIQQVAFAFERAPMLARVEEGLRAIKRAVLLFGFAGALSILLALGITLVAMRMTRRLEAYFQDLYQRAVVTELSAQLVHDLRNPLAALRANARAIVISPEQTRDIVEELDRDIVTLNKKLSDFLSLTRRHDDSLELVDVNELIADAARLARPALAKQGLSVELHIPPNLPRLTLQRSSVTDALLNVMINAGQCGQREGAVRVTAQLHPPNMRILVEDRGRGISEQDLPKLFESFFTTHAGGTGLGLSIVQRVVAAHQGSVYAENRPDGGARVVLIFPLVQKEPPSWWSKLKKHSPL
tara:strand:+ start:5489 stop:6718 length:1230 start_codon:yes stop_codon:yes gene_type:complete